MSNKETNNKPVLTMILKKEIESVKLPLELSRGVYKRIIRQIHSSNCSYK